MSEQETMNDVLARVTQEHSRLRDAAKKNPDLYRRDVQYAIDLFDDVQRGEITPRQARSVLFHVYAGGCKELVDWREALGGDASRNGEFQDEPFDEEDDDDPPY